MAKGKKATMKGPDKDSLRSKRRANRNFVSLLVSSRIHKRAAKRSIVSRTHYGRTGNAGDRMVGDAQTFVHIAGGSIRYH